jgi:hypothetical protein
MHGPVLVRKYFGAPVAGKAELLQEGALPQRQLLLHDWLHAFSRAVVFLRLRFPRFQAGTAKNCLTSATLFRLFDQAKAVAAEEALHVTLLVALDAIFIQEFTRVDLTIQHE